MIHMGHHRRAPHVVVLVEELLFILLIPHNCLALCIDGFVPGGDAPVLEQMRGEPRGSICTVVVCLVVGGGGGVAIILVMVGLVLDIHWGGDAQELLIGLEL